MKSAAQCGWGKSRSTTVRNYAVMHLQIVKADRRLTGQYVAGGPHLLGNVDRADRKPRCGRN